MWYYILLILEAIRDQYKWGALVMFLNNIIQTLFYLVILLSSPTFSAENASQIDGRKSTVDEMVNQLREQIDHGLQPMREQADAFTHLVTPWGQTLNHHLENGSLTQAVIDQIKTEAKEKGYILNISGFEKIVQNQLAQENFRNTFEPRLLEHCKNGTLTQQVVDAIRAEGNNLGIPVVIDGLPDGLH